jgi:hypothetical protein
VRELGLGCDRRGHDHEQAPVRDRFHLSLEPIHSGNRSSEIIPIGLATRRVTDYAAEHKVGQTAWRSTQHRTGFAIRSPGRALSWSWRSSSSPSPFMSGQGVPSAALAIPVHNQSGRADSRGDRSVQSGQRSLPQHSRACERSTTGRLAVLGMLRVAGRVVLSDALGRV